MTLSKKYVAKTIDDLVLPKRIKSLYTSKNPLLLYGPPGCGKSSSVDILSGRWTGNRPLRINCSLDTKIEIVRTKVLDFCEKQDLLDKGDEKTIILDEFEGVSEEFFKSLRGVMEDDKYNHVRWLATTNYINKVPDAIQSRFTLINFVFNQNDIEEIKVEWAKWLLRIVKNEGMTITQDAIKVFYQRLFPDFRKTLLKLGAIKSQGIVEILTEHVEDSSIVSYQELFNHILSKEKLTKTFTYIHTEFGRNVDDVFYSLAVEFPKWLINKGMGSKIGDVALLAHKYSYESKLGIDPATSLFCCVVELRKLFK